MALLLLLLFLSLLLSDQNSISSRLSNSDINGPQKHTMYRIEGDREKRSASRFELAGTPGVNDNWKLGVGFYVPFWS